MIRDASDRLTEKIVDQIVDILVVDPFESHVSAFILIFCWIGIDQTAA